MNQHQRFLAALKQNPFDDATRRVFADWLEEQGDRDRADFVRATADALRPLQDDGTDEGKARLLVRLAARAALRARRAQADPAWLTSIGDPGLVGEIVESKPFFSHELPLFAVIVRDKPNMVLLTELDRTSPIYRAGRYYQRPVLPTEEELVRIVREADSRR